MNLYKIKFAGEGFKEVYVVAESFSKAEEIFQKTYSDKRSITEIEHIDATVLVQEKSKEN